VRIIITGGNRGVGKATASALASAGHEVVIACRTVDEGWKAAAEMHGDIEVAQLDLADLTSVRKFAESADEVDILINNAGVLGLPPARTQDGFEAHMGINHLGHFALTCLLGERIKNRIICVTSSLYQFARLHADDLNRERRRYSSYSAYSESKLANMLFVHELGRRGRTAYAADPGSVATDIFRDANRFAALFGKFCGPRFAQTPADGARSTLAAVTTTLPSGTYFAPLGLAHQWGTPAPVLPRRKARDPEMSSKLWEMSAALTKCDWPT
jgi:NAD(P)-dependent dehydrogenase (short-subunit alcohol dehydrogenase family)